jgi:hypothetical protein
MHKAMTILDVLDTPEIAKNKNQRSQAYGEEAKDFATAKTLHKVLLFCAKINIIALFVSSRLLLGFVGLGPCPETQSSVWRRNRQNTAQDAPYYLFA